LNGQFSEGQVLGKFELLAPAAKGGSAIVWAARVLASTGGRKLVAVKTLLDADKQTRSMLSDEAALTLAIQHPNVATLLETGEYAGVPYLVMEWIDGEPLDVCLRAARGGRLPYDVGVDLVRQACQGLHAAHELRGADGELRGLVHRDVSPQNIMVTYDGAVKLVDFGIAKATHRSTRTQLGEIKGKLAYMAPEQVRGAVLDRRVDVFAMGVVLYLLTTGKHPFKATTPAETVRRICFAGAPTPPSTIAADYPPALEPVVMKALAKDPAQRQRTALELATELSQVAAGLVSDRGIWEYLRDLLADRISDRQAFLREALEAAQTRSKARDAPTLPPPRSKSPPWESQETLPLALSREGEASATLSSLRALIVSSAADGIPAPPSETTGVRSTPDSRVRRRVARFAALAAVFVACIVFSLALMPKDSIPRHPAQTSLGAPLRLAERTLATLRTRGAGTDEKPKR
jgi:eukaryotic-like serine/threonine-protein kinase